ncbi:MAG: hypothetical protein KF822_10315 [Steroidobacteraceae bacterium]|nr:hypothetical protein [Steroidobacteraceae bacterium]
MTSATDRKPTNLRPGTIVAALICAGCATERAYPGPELPPAERAVVRADPAFSAGLPVTVRLRQVDGRDLPLTTARVELAPGAHELLVDCRVRESAALARFALTVELAAGGAYRLVADATARNCEAVRLVDD